MAPLNGPLRWLSTCTYWGKEVGQIRKPVTGEKGESSLPVVSPDPCLCEPRLISNGWDGRVHQRVGLDERQGIIWKVDGGLVSFREAVFGTTARPETNTATFDHSLACWI